MTQKASAPASAGALFCFRMVGPTLAALRKNVGLTSADLAALSGMGKGQLSKYEQGKDLPKLDSLARILDALNIEPVTFFYLVHSFSSNLTPERVQAELLLLQARRREGGPGLATNLLNLFRSLLLCLDSGSGGRSLDR